MVTILLALHVHVFAQEFRTEATLPVVDSSGFYRVPLDPRISVHVNESFSNIRIFNGKGTEVPYLVETQVNDKRGTRFVAHMIEDVQQIQDSCTLIIFRKAINAPIRDITLQIRNAEVTKELILSGSDDRKTWYALKDRFYIANIASQSDVNELRIVDFPLSSYRYYRLWINDTEGALLNILQVGYYSESPEEVRYLEVPGGELSQETIADERRTYVRLRFDTLRLLDMITWNISGLPFYLREASLFTEGERRDRKGKPEPYREHLVSFRLNSAGKNELHVPGLKVDNLLLVMENDDNPPLNISGVNCYQRSRHITAWLERDSVYVLKFGEPSLRFPVYDIGFFKDSIPAEVPSIVPAAITAVPLPVVAATSSGFFQKKVIWIVLILVIALMAIMTFRLVRETKGTGS